MKDEKSFPSIAKAIPLVVIIAAILHTFLISPKAGSCFNLSCGSVGFSTGAYDSCSGTYTSHDKVAIGCGRITVSGGGTVGYCYPDIMTVSSKDIKGVSDGGSGCRITVNYDATGTNIASYTFSNAKRPGTINLTITATGKCNPNQQNDCTQAVSMTFTATAVIEFVDSGCSACSGGGGPSSNASLGANDAENNSLDFRVYLGTAGPRENAGFLWLKADAPSTALSQPGALQLPYTRTNVEVIQSGGVIEQINTLEGLVNVHVINAYEYQLECFYEKDVGSKGIDGLYTTNAPAYVTYVIQNPDGASSYNRLWITEERGGTSRQFQYTYNATNLEWDLLKPDGSTLSTWKIPDPSDSTITNYYRQVSVGSQILNLDQKTYQYISGINDIVLLQEIQGTGANTRTTTYTYYSSDSSNGGATNLLKEVLYPDGNWSYYTYDDWGRKLCEYSAWENSPAPGTNGPNVSGDDCKLVEYDYNQFADQSDPISFGFRLPQMTIVNVPVWSGSAWAWQEVSREYHWASKGYDEVQQCMNPGATFGDPSNLRTVTYTYTADAVTPDTSYEVGLPEIIDYPNGTTANFSYPDAYTTVEDDSDNTEKTTIVDDWGNILSSKTIYSGMTLNQDSYTYKDSSGNYFDPLRKSYSVADLAGRTTTYTYDCCNLNSMTYPDGVIASYDYDALKRRVASTVFYGGSSGIKTTNVFDALNRVLTVQRIGTDNSVMTLHQSEYDVLGNLVAETNALGGVTTVTNIVISNQRYVTNTYPDGGTKIEQYYRDGRLESITGTGVHGVGYQYGAEQDSDGTWREYTIETKLDASGSPTSDWTKTYDDGAEHPYKVIYAAANAPYPYSESYYNGYGQVWKYVDADTNINLYTYNPYSGLKEYSVVALSDATRLISDYSTLQGSLGTIEGGIDRVTRTEKVFESAANGVPDLIENDIYVWTNGETDGNGTLISVSQTATTTLTNWNIVYRDANTPVTNMTVIFPGTSRFETNFSPDASYVVNTYSYGRLASTVRYDSANNQIAGTTFGYDPHGRQSTLTDARNGATTYAFNTADLVTEVTTPNPGTPGGTAETTTTYYNTMLQATNVVRPDGAAVTNIYLLTGELGETYGSRTYPVTYTYDYAGRMETIKTWQNFAGNSGTATTTWVYDGYRGFLTNKTYDGGTPGPGYTYTPGGRLRSRTWARGITTTYNYDNGGELTNIAYSDGVTSSVTNTYDRLGRTIQVGTADLVTEYSYNIANQLLVETNTAGILAALAVTNGYDAYLRRTDLSAIGAGVLSHVTYTYDNASRLSAVSDGTNSATYSYIANSPLVGQIAFKSNSVTAMTTTKTYDYLNRLTQISNAPTASAAVVFNYAYNDANQRTKVTLIDGSYWIYQYDSLGQVTSGKKYWADGTPVAGQQFGYSFDDIGNRTQTKSGGDETGSNLRVANYSDNTLNQTTSRDVPGYVDILGIALATNTVSVNGLPAYRKGEYFRKELEVDNSSTPQWTNITVLSPGQATVTGNKYLPKTQEVFGYDADGNLTNDGRWAYAWDAENRLIKMTVNTNVGPQYQLLFAYDAKGRRIQKMVSTNSVGIYTNKFIYDGWNLITVLAPNSSLLSSYVWGLDLSGTMRGAGGIGGLLAIGAGTTNCFLGYDGNGNVTMIADTTGTNIGIYEYGPFGELLRATTGPMAKANPFRFSTKYQDDETGLCYYCYRYYSPSKGNWLSIDPIGERGGLNLYGFVDGNPLNSIDIVGLDGTVYSDGPLPNPVLPPGLQLPTSTPPSTEPGNPGSSSPRPPRQNPPQWEDPNPAAPVSTCTGAVANGLIEIAGQITKTLDSQMHKDLFNDAVKQCIAKGKCSGGCPWCCVVSIFGSHDFPTTFPLNVTWKTSSGGVIKEPCSDVKKDFANQPELRPSGSNAQEYYYLEY